jgi:opacity protein-like surface antigen
MKIINIAGLIAAAVAVAVSGSPVSAADLGGQRGGSIKDDGYEAAAPVMRGPAGPCYMRGDLGYSWSRSPSQATWAVSTFTRNYNGADQASSTNYADSNYAYVGDTVTETSLSNSAFGGVGLGCGSGSRGIRGEVMLNQTGSRNFTGTPNNFGYTEVFTAPNPNPPITIVDPIHASVKSTTLMFNGYKDLGSFGGITPYIGAGVGVSYNKMSDVYFTGNPFLLNTIGGASRTSLAWSLMAGVGYQMNERAILDLGYRYMDYGKAESGRVDNTGAINPPLRINDITAHEFKVGLRYHFGSSDAQQVYQPMK